MIDLSEQRELNIIFSKSGCGSLSSKLSLPISWLYRLGIDKNNRKVLVFFDDTNKVITIEKY